jgi:hypothetical protein
MESLNSQHSFSGGDCPQWVAISIDRRNTFEYDRVKGPPTTDSERSLLESIRATTGLQSHRWVIRKSLLDDHAVQKCFS